MLAGWAEAWEADVLRPLRAVRRHLKPAAADDPQTAALRAQVQESELEAERLLHRRLEEWLSGRQQSAAMDAFAARLRSNLSACFVSAGGRGKGCNMTDSDMAQLVALLGGNPG